MARTFSLTPTGIILKSYLGIKNSSLTQLTAKKQGTGKNVYQIFQSQGKKIILSSYSQQTFNVINPHWIAKKLL